MINRTRHAYATLERKAHAGNRPIPKQGQIFADITGTQELMTCAAAVILTGSTSNCLATGGWMLSSRADNLRVRANGHCRSATSPTSGSTETPKGDARS